MDNSIGRRKTIGGDPAADRSVGGWDTMRSGAAGRRFRAGEVVLGRYRVIDELGQGGMGVVYRCFDEVAGINVALKALPPEVGHNAGEMEEVRENFRLVEKLHHPNIANVKTLEKDPVTGDYYLVMECVEGLDLRQWARKRRGEGRPLTTDEVVTVAYRIAEALDYAHSQRVIHRDIKPSNVRITFDGDVKVLDFGLAAQIYTSMSRVSRAYHGTSGTGPYMAPEQWQGRRQDAAADQYALAASVYELLSGAPPFENHDVSVLREAVLKDRPEPLAGVPEHVNAALMRALAKEPGERFATCGEFVAALGGARAETQRRGGKRTVLWLAAAVALAFGTYGTYASYRSYTARRAAERAAAERALALDAAQKAKIDGLKAAAEGALAAGDLESAGARIAELKAAGAPAAGELQKRYEAKAGERETNRRYAAASVAREKAAKLERGQGFGARLDALEVTWREAEAARQGGVWGQALSGYDAVLAASKALEELEASREEAKARRGDAERAKAEADQANSASDAKDLYAEGGRGSTRAGESFEKGDFTAASAAWRDAAQGYASAKTRALAAQAYARAKAAFESALGGPSSVSAVRLERYGGGKWAEVKRLRALGAASENDPAAGEKAYRDALAALPGAEAEAQAAERAAVLAAALAAARQAKTAGEWQACLDKADEALALEAGNAEALALKAEAERNLTPTLTVECEVPGARVSDGRQTYDAPHTFALEAGRRYNFVVKAGDDARRSTLDTRYKPASFEITADWRGPKTRRVTLEEVKGPVEGENYVVDLGGGVGLEVVWIPPGTTTLGSTQEERDWAAGPEGQGRAEWFTDEGSPQTARIAKGFWLGQTEVTVGQWRRFAASEGYRTEAEKGGYAYIFNPRNEYKFEKTDGKSWRDPGFSQTDSHPAVCLSWNDAKAFCKWVNARERAAGRLPEGCEWRLPGEAEWAYACRGGREGVKFWWGDSLAEGEGRLNGASPDVFPGMSETCWQATYSWKDGYAFTAPCGSYGMKGRNGYGLSDMLGNIWEWCEDGYDPNGPHTEVWTNDTSRRVHRGGSFGDRPGALRCADRAGGTPAFADANSGFRLCLGRCVP